MSKIGLFFDTDTGNTRKVGKMIKKQFEDGEIELMNIAKATPDDLLKYKALILGTPTLGDGELPDMWQAFLPKLEGLDFSGTTIALYGLGDQVGYGHEFVDGLGLLFEAFEALGASFVGAWPLEGYTYEISRAEIDGEFVGLVIDQDNQSSMTQDRVTRWVEQIKAELQNAAAA